MGITEQGSPLCQAINVWRQHPPFVTSQAPDPILHVVDREEQHIRHRSRCWLRFGIAVGLILGCGPTLRGYHIPQDRNGQRREELGFEVLPQSRDGDGHFRSPGIVPSPVGLALEQPGKIESGNLRATFGAALKMQEDEAFAGGSRSSCCQGRITAGTVIH